MSFLPTTSMTTMKAATLQAGSERPSLPPAHGHAKRRRNQHLRKRAGNGNGPHRQQIVEREMQSNPEHQENDADLGELVGQSLIRNESRREGPEHNAG